MGGYGDGRGVGLGGGGGHRKKVIYSLVLTINLKEWPASSIWRTWLVSKFVLYILYFIIHQA